MAMERHRDDRLLAYRVDADDRIVFCSDGWLGFAQSNGGVALAPGAVFRRPLWGFICDEETRHLYRLILRRARGGKRVVVQLRCDSPSCRRHVELRVERVRDGVVQFESEILAEEPRAYVPLLDAALVRSIDVVSICGWCKRVRVPGSGLHEVEEAVRLLGLAGGEPPQLAHICCYDCYRRILDCISDA